MFKAQTNIGQGFEEGFNTFRTCSHTNCFITKNNSMLDDPNYIIDAVVLQGDAIQINELRKLKELKQNRKLLKQRNRGIIPKIVLFNRVCLMEQFFHQYFTITLKFDRITLIAQFILGESKASSYKFFFANFPRCI